MHEITRILAAVDQGDTQAAERLLPLVYDELRKLAAQRLAQEKPGQTLQATALVHEAYLRVVASADASAPQEQQWNSRGHFFAAAAEAMRRILVDSARKKRRPKHGGDRQRVQLDDLSLPVPNDRAAELLALDEALTELAKDEPVKAELVKLRYFGGLTMAEAAACLGVSPATAKRYWTVARAWLYDRLAGG